MSEAARGKAEINEVVGGRRSAGEGRAVVTAGRKILDQMLLLKVLLL